MLDAMQALAERSVLDRVVLFTNHVIGAEAAAVEKLKGHVGRRFAVELADWPALLPAPKPLVLRVTPAGLVERVDVDGPSAAPDDALPADLRVVFDSANPAVLAYRLATGDRASIRVEGNPAFAADVQWLVDNLRWDAREDLAKVIGDAPAEQLARVGSQIARALREGVTTIRERTSEWRR